MRFLVILSLLFNFYAYVFLLFFNIHQEFSIKKTQIYSTLYQNICLDFVHCQFFDDNSGFGNRIHIYSSSVSTIIWLLRVTFIITWIVSIFWYLLHEQGDVFFYALLLLRNIWYPEVRINFLSYIQILVEWFYFCCGLQYVILHLVLL